MPADQPRQPTESCPGCGAVLVPLPDGGPCHPGASPSCARLFEVTVLGLREDAASSSATAAEVALADAAYDAQHPVPGDGERLRAALDRLGVPPDAATDGTPGAWRTTIADVAADLDVIDLTVLVASWAARCRRTGPRVLPSGSNGTVSALRTAITTLRGYADTVGNLTDRRARKKAQTREQIRAVAHRMFAAHGFNTVTIADVAREADVAVQTVFNHFATKEELFFDGRVPWVDGPADAVRSRAPGVPALTALRTHLVTAVHDLVSSHSAPERACYIATLQASDTLRVQERELVHVAELRLREALLEAWTAESADDEVPVDPGSTASLVAAMWLAAGRSLIIGQRPDLTEGADPGQAATAAAALADGMLAGLEQSVELVRRGAGTTGIRTDTGWPHAIIRRAG